MIGIIDINLDNDLGAPKDLALHRMDVAQRRNTDSNRVGKRIN